MSITSTIWDQTIKAHEEAVARGEHDEHCEWRPAGFYICHCSKRRRERAGYTTPPGELIHQMPLCPRCDQEVDHDGDNFTCPRCCVYWDRAGDADFYDDHGDLLAELTKWESKWGGREL